MPMYMQLFSIKYYQRESDSYLVDKYIRNIEDSYFIDKIKGESHTNIPVHEKLFTKIK